MLVSPSTCRCSVRWPRELNTPQLKKNKTHAKTKLQIDVLVLLTTKVTNAHNPPELRYTTPIQKKCCKHTNTSQSNKEQMTTAIFIFLQETKKEKWIRDGHVCLLVILLFCLCDGMSHILNSGGNLLLTYSSVFITSLPIQI